ncbi:hypothetical protein NODU109028_15620 [Nocardioides dubius]|uniref:Uncharacterized protein n=1 Tax=Nocardioides dubius TaxID=317019 RepID=A0ABP4EN52_9ACTN
MADGAARAVSAPGGDRWVTHWLSPARFAVYVEAAAGDRAGALALYEWNAS